MAAPNSTKVNGPLLVGGVSLLAFVIALGVLYALGSRARRKGEGEVSQVAKMNPLDPKKTKQIFQLSPDGGLQTVIVIDASDETEIAAVQQYLGGIAARFQKGDFSAAAALGGEAIPGVAELKAGAEKMTIRYAPLANGGQIRYIASDPELIRATHRWLMAQLSAEARLGGQ
ncbi:MAG TPA: hypothetical protein VNL14_02760 [Candidatus Acidoferrales bacterium]|nr:hypothetical protein [Candidatus Acidoferrales bacterium]